MRRSETFQKNTFTYSHNILFVYLATTIGYKRRVEKSFKNFFMALRVFKMYQERLYT